MQFLDCFGFIDTAGLAFVAGYTGNQFPKRPELRSEFRNHRWKALKKTHLIASGTFFVGPQKKVIFDIFFLGAKKKSAVKN